MPQQSKRTRRISSHEVQMTLSDGQVHPRLRLEARIIPDQHGSGIHDFVRVDIVGCPARNRFEKYLYEARIEKANSKSENETEAPGDTQDIPSAETSDVPKDPEEADQSTEDGPGFGEIKRLLIEYLKTKLQATPNNPTINRLTRNFMKRRLTIFELEDLDEIDSITTDYRGRPADTSCPPVEINIQVIRQAIETRNLVFTEGYLAFVPQGTWSLIGRMQKGHMNLVLIPERIMPDIISFEEQCFNLLLQILQPGSTPQEKDKENPGTEDPNRESPPEETSTVP